jgi:F-type H+-transporting ATPase subunit delta
MVSRVQVATYVADHLESDRPAALQAAASWLLDNGAARQARYLAQDVAQVLADRGYVLARVTTARPLAPAAAERIEEFIKKETGARHLELVTAIDPSLIGGARVDLPGSEMDGTVKAKLAKFVEGVSR